jgi:hypothetical protein
MGDHARWFSFHAQVLSFWTCTRSAILMPVTVLRRIPASFVFPNLLSSIFLFFVPEEAVRELNFTLVFAANFNHVSPLAQW